MLGHGLISILCAGCWQTARDIGRFWRCQLSAMPFDGAGVFTHRVQLAQQGAQWRLRQQLDLGRANVA